MKRIFWADQVASRIIKERKRKRYTVASGITPSGTIHIGNFREEMTVDLVNRALKDRGKKVRYIHSWDDFDRFRKVPGNVPKTWKKYLGMPVSEVPDPFNCHKSYASHFEEEFMNAARDVGVKPEYQFQSKFYTTCKYKDEIKFCMNKRDQIINILNKYRTQPLPRDWYPITIYCEKCKKDSTRVLEYDGNYTIKYSCDCGYTGQINFSKKGRVKLKWRVDWPMRWRFYQVDFEPGGKEHSTRGGSRDTAGETSKEIFSYTPPIYLMYDYIILKGKGGKMSGSLGNVVSLKELNEVYIPEVVRYFYAGTKPGREFAIPLDDEIFKVYEDFYRTERLYFGKEKESNKKKKAHLKRVYEMSTVDRKSRRLPIQIPFKYMAYLSQISKSFASVLESLKETKHITRLDSFDKARLKYLYSCAVTWIKRYAESKYKFELQEKRLFRATQKEKEAIKMLIKNLARLKEEDLYAISKKTIGIDFFKLCYRILINKTHGPRLYDLIQLIGKSKVRKILQKYVTS